jgi:HSP20 family molecular chaperone IbpA
MARDDTRDWMWSEALQMLAQAERLHRQVFRPVPGPRGASWEPPVDVLETRDAVLILAALPGVDPEQVEAVIDSGTLILSGERTLPDEMRTAVIHRLELPQGRFERRIELPPGRYSTVRSVSAHGCLVISLAKAPRVAR